MERSNILTKMRCFLKISKFYLLQGDYILIHIYLKISIHIYTSILYSYIYTFIFSLIYIYMCIWICMYIYIYMYIWSMIRSTYIFVYISTMGNISAEWRGGTRRPYQRAGRSHRSEARPWDREDPPLLVSLVGHQKNMGKFENP